MGNKMDLDRSFTRIQKILNKNKDKEFVQRILSPDTSPFLDNEDGSYSTHSMAYGEADGKFFVYPTVVKGEEGNLTRLKGREAWEHAMGTGETIEFDNEKDAEWFSKNYKKYWDSIGKRPNRQ